VRTQTRVGSPQRAMTPLALMGGSPPVCHHPGQAPPDGLFGCLVPEERTDGGVSVLPQLSELSNHAFE
jgi:hypothetical protein